MLFSTTANDGHFGPLVGLARACVRAGHEVRVAAPQSFAAAVQRAELAHLPFADAPADLIGPVMARLPTLSFDDANATVVREVFGRIDAQAALPALLGALRTWRPDVVVRDPAEFGSLAAAVRLKVPHVQVAIGMSEMSRLLAELTVEPLTELAALAGVPEATVIEAVSSEPTLSSVPEALDRAGDPAAAFEPVLLRFRDGDGDGTAVTDRSPLPAWGAPEHPLVYVTFGSVTGSLAPFAGVFRQALTGLAELPLRVFMTVGRRMDPRGLHPAPANARVESWWPQPDVLAEAAAVLGHGGFGTTMGAVRAGVPQVVVPLFSTDQLVNGRHVAAAGAGRCVQPGPDSITEACGQVATVLTDPGYRSGAQALAAASAELAPVEDAVAVLQRLTRSA